MPFAELCVCMVVVCGSGRLYLSILEEDVSEDACLKSVCVACDNVGGSISGDR